MPAPILVLVLEEGLEPDEPIPEPQDTPKDQPDQVDQYKPLNGIELQAPIFLVVNNP